MGRGGETHFRRLSDRHRGLAPVLPWNEGLREGHEYGTRHMITSLVNRVAARLLGLLVRVAESSIRHGAPQGTAEYLDPGEFSWTAALENNWRDIRNELDRVLMEREKIPSFQDVSEEQRAITNDDRWKVYVFYVFGTPIEKNCRGCPRTTELLGRVPGLRNAMFSILSPHKDIPEHRGLYNGLLRYHLALKVPQAAEACNVWVNGLRRGWHEGKTLIFDDSFPHSVRNDTAEERVVLFADFERPLPWPLASLNRWIIALLASTPLAQRPIELLERGEI